MDWNSWFWNEDFWLPGNYTWEFMVSNKKVQHPIVQHLLYPVVIGVLLVCVRVVVERWILDPVGRKLGVVPPKTESSSRTKETNNALRVNYELLKSKRREAGESKKNGKLDYKEVETLAGSSGLSVRHVERWLRKEKSQGEASRPVRLKKFSESGWRFLCYSFLSIMGLGVLTTKQWFWDTRESWSNWPHQGIEDGVWWYYMATCGFYWSLVLTQVSDVKRKDFAVMFIHHAVTIILISFSWIVNLTRFGSLIIIAHDVADAPLELTKMAVYIKNYKLCQVSFWAFAALWTIGRLIVLPFVIIRSTLFDSLRLMKIPPCPLYYIINSMLIFLLLMHLVWTYFIAEYAKKIIVEKKYMDTRSSDEESEDDQKLD